VFDNKMKRTGIIVIVAIVLGLAYGCMSGIKNQNPYYSPDGKELHCDSEHHPAWEWQPSPAWIPSFLLCKAPINGFGISHTRSGYLFRSETNRTIYLAGSTILGGIIGCLAGCAFLISAQKKRDRLSNHYATSLPAPPHDG